eukprot:7008767-Pyramimonas_sp.AAC.1
MTKNSPEVSRCSPRSLCCKNTEEQTCRRQPTKPRCRDSYAVVRTWKRRAKTSPSRQTSHPCQGLCWDTARVAPSLPMSSSKPHG